MASLVFLALFILLSVATMDTNKLATKRWPNSTKLSRGSTTQFGLPEKCMATAVVASALPHPYAEADPAKLRRIPRIYNALITTDEQLLPSQAYPAVAPVLRPYGYAPVPYALPTLADPYGTVYQPDPYQLQAYTRLPGFNDTLRDPDAAAGPPIYNLQPQQAVPKITDQVKNNRPGNRDIPDVPPPPLPVSRPRGPGDQSPERKPDVEYPPAPSQGLPF